MVVVAMVLFYCVVAIALTAYMSMKVIVAVITQIPQELDRFLTIIKQMFNTMMNMKSGDVAKQFLISAHELRESSGA